MDVNENDDPTTGGAQAPRRVAVIAVHGVADQQSGDTARRIAGLLARHRPDPEGDFAYQAPAEVPLKVGVRPPDLDGRGDGGEATGKDRMSFIQPRVRAHLESERGAMVRGAGGETLGPGETLGEGVLRDQLAAVELPPADEVWETLRLETLRHADGCETHVYEMYWADLSRLGDKLLSPLLGLYQLLFFLPVLGSRTLAFARACVPGAATSRVWTLWAGTHALATRILAWGVPILNLLLLTLLTVVALLAIDSSAPWLLALIPALVVFAVGAWLLYRTRERPLWDKLPWPLRLLLLTLLVAGAWAFWTLVDRPAELHLAAAPLWLLCAGAVLGLLWVYDRRLPGAFAAGVASTLLFGAALAYAVRAATDLSSLVDAATHFAYRTVYWVHWILWLAFAAAAALSMLCGWVANLRAPREERPKLRRARWTVDLTLAVAAPLVLVLDLALWAALLYLGERFLGAGDDPVVDAEAFAGWREVLIAATPPWQIWLGWVALIAVALVVSLWAVWPAARSDAQRRRRVAAAPAWIGRALTQGFGAARGAGELMRWGLLVVGLPASALATWAWRSPTLTASTERQHWEWTILALGTVLAAAVLGRGPLAFLALGLRTALDIAFDVVNWLRSDPPQQTTSARILSRYFSLLRHVETWRHPADGGRYGAIVIVAHSQGAVITAEGLRLRRRFGRRAADSPAIHLLTMGAPLHQLYGLRFPYRYRWAWSDGPWEESAASDPEALGVAGWTNLYHSGDYVGRFLWHPQSAARSEAPYDEATRRQGKRTERCLGAGGHNTYWDGHSPAVTETLDRLIAEACPSGPAPRPA